MLLVLGFRSPSFDLSDGFIGWLDQNYMAKEGRINCIRRDRYGDFLTEGYFGNKVKNSMAVVVGWFLLTQISRHRFKKMGGFTRIKDFFNCTGRIKSEGFLEYI